MMTAEGGRYYTGQVRPDYYTGGGESPGQWHDNAAVEAERFHGEVVKEDIERLFDGYHPKTGEQLAKNHGRDDRRAAIDMCISVPKTVSALWAAADESRRRELEQAFGRALDKTLAYVNAECGYRQGQGATNERMLICLLRYISIGNRGDRSLRSTATVSC